ncbi:uncharacterized protein CLUP02_04339 [Colletotrichum lupini]|uniref:Uncharacterized protein n=1 Tax=Colletotrichum lupini TaxID=145971 RepID=A0A9Q8WDN7_9PEZI|nr:uncharacterized protein CLUP02_04339 [Colletotrichum lupini]UQC78860.1 hypothetical protein CLUP02_04339 [Colletotrichum lupini]
MTSWPSEPDRASPRKAADEARPLALHACSNPPPLNTDLKKDSREHKEAKDAIVAEVGTPLDVGERSDRESSVGGDEQEDDHMALDSIPSPTPHGRGEANTNAEPNGNGDRARGEDQVTCVIHQNRGIREFDTKELKPGGVQRFRQRFVKDGLATLITSSDSTTVQNSTADQDSRSGVSLPPPAHSLSERSRSSSSRQNSGSGTFSSRPGSSTPVSETLRSEEVAFHPEEQNPPQYLLLCVNLKSLPVLKHIDCSSFWNDQYLFQHILERYQTIREESTSENLPAFPPLVRAILDKGVVFLRKNTPSWLDWMFKKFQKLSEASLFSMHTGDYVQLLIPFHRGIQRSLGIDTATTTGSQHFQNSFGGRYIAYQERAKE